MKKKWMVPLVCIACITILITIIVKFIKEEDKPRVVVVLQELNTEHSKIVKAGVEKGFDDFNIDGEVIAPDSQYPSLKQITLLKEVLKDDPDALIVTPTQSSATIPVLQEYQKRSIPVLMLNQDVEWKDQTSFIGTDHLQLGKVAGMLLSSSLQPGDQVVFVVNAQFGLVETDWVKGAKESVENVGIKVITVQQENDESGNVKPVLSSILKTYPDIKGVYVTNENTALEALKVIEEKALKIPVVGTNVSMAMLEAVEEEKLSAILIQSPWDMGYLSVAQALKAIKGEQVDKRIDSRVEIVTKDYAKLLIDFYEKNVFK